MANGLYLYCIADGHIETNFGTIGINGQEVYSIVYEDLSAIVHDLIVEQEKVEGEKLNECAVKHAQVVDTVWEKFGTILPLTFYTVIKGDEKISPVQNLKNWMRDDYKNLKQKLTKVTGKAEYAIKIFWSTQIIGALLIQNDPEIRTLHATIETSQKGLAYMYKQKLENLLKKKIEAEAERYFNDFYKRIAACVSAIKVEATKKVDLDKQMLMNLSCLMSKEDSAILGKELDLMSNINGIFVRFTGPWAPYSFV